MSTLTPRYVTCPRCQACVLEARWDYQNDTLFGTPLLDPVALNSQQLVACVITDVPLWQVHKHAGRHVTSRRTHRWPTRPVPGATVPAHACGRTWPGQPLQLAPDPTTIPDTCPF